MLFTRDQASSQLFAELTLAVAAVEHKQILSLTKSILPGDIGVVAAVLIIFHSLPRSRLMKPLERKSAQCAIIGQAGLHKSTFEIG